MDNNETNIPSTNFGSGENPCDICGSSDFQWGNLVAKSANTSEQRLWFRPQNSGPEDGDYFTETRRCEICGNIKIFSSI